MRPRTALLLLLPTALGAQQVDTPLLVAPSAEGVILRWVWPEGERPLAWHVERREPQGAWTRLTSQPIARLRSREAARLRLGEAYDRYEGLLFPPDPRDELRDPDSFRSLQLLMADLEPAIAHALGLRYDDTGAPRNGVFEYRLIAVTRAGEREAARGGPVVAGDWQQPAGPDSVRAAQATDGVALSWSTAGAFSAYQVFRRRGAGDWERVNAVPVVAFSADGPVATKAPRLHLDTLARAGDTLAYAVTGIDPFGRASRRSAESRLVVRDVRPPAAPLQVTTAVRGDTVVVAWVPSPDPQVTGYRVWRGAAHEGPFTPLGAPLSATARTVHDAGVSGGASRWYYVTAIDAAGHESPPSFLALAAVPDLTPPPPPAGLRAVSDTARITISWQPVTEGGLRGYRVYRSSTTGGTFALLTPRPITEPAYEDRVRRGADHAFYYRVTAVDSLFNESPPSPVLEARPPDMRAPSAPRIESVRPCEDCLAVSWLANPEPDVAAYRVRYRRRGEEAWSERPQAVRAPARRDTIPGLAARQLYDVIVVAIDDAGNVSAPSPAVSGEPMHRRPPAPLALRRARYEAAQRAVVVEWQAVDGVARVRIERRDRATGEVRLLADVAADAGRYLDARLTASARYEYAARAVDRFGNVAEPVGWRRVDVPAEHR